MLSSAHTGTIKMCGDGGDSPRPSKLAEVRYQTQQSQFLPHFLTPPISSRAPAVVREQHLWGGGSIAILRRLETRLRCYFHINFLSQSFRAKTPGATNLSSYICFQDQRASQAGTHQMRCGSATSPICFARRRFLGSPDPPLKNLSENGPLLVRVKRPVG